MATDWTAEQKAAYEDFKAEGFQITVRLPAEKSDFVEEHMEYWSDGSDTDYTTYAIKKKYSKAMIDGTRITSKDQRLLFPAYGLPALTSKYQILIDSEELNVINLDVVDPGNVALIYEAQIRS